VHGIVRRELDEKAAYMGPRIASDMRAPVPGVGLVGFDQAVEVLRVKEYRRKLFLEAARFTGMALADFLEDREGWHGLDRQEKTEEIARGSS